MHDDKLIKSEEDSESKLKSTTLNSRILGLQNGETHEDSDTLECVP